jgi:hypothetical protein
MNSPSPRIENFSPGETRKRALKIVYLIVVLVGIAMAPRFAHAAAVSVVNAKTLAARKSIPHHRPAIGAHVPIVRDSIGRRIARPAPAIEAAHVGPMPRMPAKSIGTASPIVQSSINRAAWPKSLAVGSPANGSSAVGAPHGGVSLQHSGGTASLPNRGRIDGATLIRPKLAPSSLGGPAKMSGGIDGTAFKPKH